MSRDERYQVRLASDAADLRSTHRLRYQVFVTEMGATGPLVDHAAGEERDEFDAHFDQLVLIDTSRNPHDFDHVVGAYRLLPGDRLDQVGRFYSESEFDLSRLKASGRRLLELGRSCIHADHRGGAGMLLLWNALARYVTERNIEVMFGAASFPGTDPQALAAPLSYLHHHHLAPEELRVFAHGPHAISMDLLPADQIQRSEALKAMPALIKAYLRLGGAVGQGAFIDHAFNTTDICLVVDTAQMSGRHRDFYTRKATPA